MVGSGAGSRLPTAVLATSGLCTLIAVAVSAMSIYLQWKNYRKPALQRMVVRIMLMVPIYAIASLISLFSLEAAFVIDAIRDIYEAFVIYCFFVLLLSYLGGERSTLIRLHGRPPKAPVFPVNLFKREIDVSDPYTFLFIKRGIFQYVQVKPILAIVTLILKACNKFNEGDLRWDSGYLYVSVVYNTSICLSLYCLALFWMCINDDIKPFRPVPKFLCVKGILFFSFWQAIAISILVAAGVIKRLGPYTDPEYVSLGLIDTLVCVEMPFFAVAHLYAFSYTDFIDHSRSYVARMPMLYAFRDSFGLLDVVQDARDTLAGEGMDYRAFEPSEGIMHQGDGRERRIKAGLRYTKGGQGKYWLPRPDQHTHRVERVVDHVVERVGGSEQAPYAPIIGDDDQVVHLAPDLQPAEDTSIWSDGREDGYELPFGDPDPADDELYEHSRKFMFGDYNYPCIDVSSEGARNTMWDEEERILRDERGAWGVKAPMKQTGIIWKGYGAVDTLPRPTPSGNVRIQQIKNDTSSRSNSHSGGSSPAESSGSTPRALSRSNSGSVSGSPAKALPPDAVDLIVEDPHKNGTALKKVYRQGLEASDGTQGEVQVEPESEDQDHVQVGEDLMGSIEQDEIEVLSPPENESREEIFVRSETPPAHARVILDSGKSDDEANPWA